MDVIEYTPTREQYAYTFGGAAPGHADQARHRAAALVRRRVLWRPAQRRRPVEREGRPALRQPADRPVLRRGRRARRHAGAAPRRAGAGPRLGCVGGDPVLRRHDEHRPRRHPAGPAARHHLDLRARPRPQHGRLRGTAQRPPHRAAGRADARHRRRRAGRRRGALLAGARPLRRQHGHPADAGRLDGLPRRQRRGRDVLHRRRALPPGRGRGLRHGGRGRDDHHPRSSS